MSHGPGVTHLPAPWSRAEPARRHDVRRKGGLRVLEDRRGLLQRRRFPAIRRAEGNAGAERHEQPRRTHADGEPRRRHQDLHVRPRPAGHCHRKQARADRHAGSRGNGLVTPDYVMPDRFMPTDGGTREFRECRSRSLRRAPRPTASTRYSRHAPGANIGTNLATNFAGRSRIAARHHDQRRRVLQPGARPLLHQPARARHRCAGHGRLRRLGAHRAHVQRVSDAGQRRRRRQSGVPLLHSAAARQFAFFLRVAG